MQFQLHRFCIAPMMDWTDRHCRFFHRLLTGRARLYTEMVTAEAILHGDRQRLLAFNAEEHPVALQLGGSDPARLAQAAAISPSRRGSDPPSCSPTGCSCGLNPSNRSRRPCRIASAVTISV